MKDESAGVKSCLGVEDDKRKRTSKAVMMCSGEIVFFDSLSHISFACDETRWMNSKGFYA